MTNPKKAGIVGAVVIGGFHLCWVLLILSGFAQVFIDFVFWAHMVKPIYVIQAFDVKAALTLLVITSAVGYAFGAIGGIVWNKLHKA